MTTPALSLPLVAYRGLWDKFAAPGSPEAFRRAYVRGVPCVLRADEGYLDAFSVCTLANNPNVNRRGQALYFASDAHGAAGLRVLSRWTGLLWARAGLYVPARARFGSLDATDFVILDSLASPIVLVESLNVLSREEELAVGLTDDDVVAEVEALAGGGVRIARVSDFVELDQLERQRGEAA